MAIFGLKPGVTPCKEGGNHKVRRAASHQERYERRILRFMRGLIEVSRGA